MNPVWYLFLTAAISAVVSALVAYFVEIKFKSWFEWNQKLSAERVSTLVSLAEEVDLLRENIKMVIDIETGPPLSSVADLGSSASVALGDVAQFREKHFYNLAKTYRKHLSPEQLILVTALLELSYVRLDRPTDYKYLRHLEEFAALTLEQLRPPRTPRAYPPQRQLRSALTRGRSLASALNRDDVFSEIEGSIPLKRRDGR